MTKPTKKPTTTNDAQADHLTALLERVFTIALGESPTPLHAERVAQAIDAGIAHWVYDGTVPADVAGRYLGASALRRAWRERQDDLTPRSFRARADVAELEEGISTVFCVLLGAKRPADWALILAVICRAYRADPCTIAGTLSDAGVTEPHALDDVLHELDELGRRPPLAAPQSAAVA